MGGGETMSESMKPEEIKVEDESVVVEEEGFNVAEGEGDNGVKVSVSVEKT